MPLFDEFATLREDNKLEYKSAKGGMPRSFWETYSAFANTDGGVVVLGAKEGNDGLPSPSGIVDPHKLRKELWDGLNNRKKTSANVLVDDDIVIEQVGNSSVVVVRVPRANRELRPVFINGDMLGGSYRRNGEGDYHCTRREVNAMVRDSFSGDVDRQVLDHIGMDALDGDTLRVYRQAFGVWRPNHPWGYMGDEEFLMRLGAVARSDADALLHPTRAGLLMFGQDWRITDEFPEYFLDCRQVAGGERWDNRIVSNSGDWSGNVYDFYRRAYRMLTEDLPIPFRLDENMLRVDDTAQHKAVREALANALMHADYYDRCGIVAIRYGDRVEIRNPGGLRMSANVVRAGGYSDTRNATLMKMFNLVGIGEKAGSGFDVMRQGTRSVSKPDPTIEELHEPDVVLVTLPLETRGMGASLPQRLETDPHDPNVDPNDPNLDRKNDRKAEKQSQKQSQSAKTSGKAIGKRKEERLAAILSLAHENGKVTSGDIRELLGVSQPRARAIAREMLESGLFERRGDGRSTCYVATELRGEQ